MGDIFSALIILYLTSDYDVTHLHFTGNTDAKWEKEQNINQI